MTRLTARLTRVEGDILRRRPEPTEFQVLWNDELEPCAEHALCYVEPESGSHHGRVIRLSFEMSALPGRWNS